MHWTVRLDGGPRRVNHAAVAIGDKVYSFGGYCCGENYDTRQPIDVHVLDSVTYRWRSLPQLDVDCETAPYQRYGHTAVEYRGKAYIWGGRNDIDGASGLLHEYDPVSNSWRLLPTMGRAPPARDGHSACVIDDLMVVFGGFEEEFQRFSQETFVFNFRTNRWSELKTFGVAPAWRDFHTATAIGRRMYVFGGRSDQLGQFHSSRDVYFDKLKYLDLADTTWYEPDVFGDRPSGRRSHSAWCYRDKLYIFGGFSGALNRHFDDMYEFDPVPSRWTKINPVGLGPTARRRQCTVLVGRRVFLFGGTKPSRAPKTNPLTLQNNPLADLSDLFVFDYAPSLKELAAMTVLNSGQYETLVSCLPRDLRNDLQLMTQPNRISGPREELYG
uniref:Kelch domain-containing protein 3 n=1 Tax=Plectus sambesii TaxID=2011161 RepID=A0A914WP69_9BILA